MIFEVGAPETPPTQRALDGPGGIGEDEPDGVRRLDWTLRGHARTPLCLDQPLEQDILTRDEWVTLSVIRDGL
jgi:hypothetical protein